MNLIWIVSDTLRRDHLGCYGNNKMHTPVLDSLAANSVKFDRHYLASFPTMPARADFYTGLFTGCFMNWEALPKEQRTLPRILRDKGLHTAAVVDTPFYLRNNMNYDLGFRTFIEVAGQTQTVDDYSVDVRQSWRFESDRFAPQSFTKAMRWLERHYKEDFFLYIDVWDPHEPWDAPNYYTELYWPDYDGENIYPIYRSWKDVPGYTEEKVKKAHACYCGEITMVDTWIGHFLRHLENLGLTEDTAIIFTTDHGFYFGEHGGTFGKTTRVEPKGKQTLEDGEKSGWVRSPLYQEVIRCPLIINVPGIKPAVYNGMTSATDLMPTVLDILGQEIPDGVEGASLLPSMKDPTTKGREYVVSSIPLLNTGDKVSMVDGIEREMQVDSDSTITTEDWTLLYSPSFEPMLFNNASDPKQENDVIAKHPDIARELHQKFVDFLKKNNVSERLLKPRLEIKL